MSRVSTQARRIQTEPAGGTGREAGRPAAAARFREVLSVGEYRAMWSGQVLSAAGDQFCRVALTILVYDRTRSPLWTALAYAGSYLPWVVGGLVLGQLADRWPRRTLLVACDLARAGLITVMAAPGMPLPVMVALLYVVTVLDGPFRAARSAAYADMLPDGPRYSLGVAVASSANTTATVVGFAAGGVLVGAAGARAALLADAATFVVSAALIWFRVVPRPASRRARDRGPARHPGGAVRLVFGDRLLRRCTLFGWLAAFYTVPEALAVPYTASLHAGPGAAGLMFASGPLGTAAGLAVFGRLARRDRQARWMGPLAVLCCGSLALCLARPGLAWSLLLFAGSGALGCYQVSANAQFVAALPADRRGEGFGIAAAGLMAAQGAAYLAAGAAAGLASSQTVIAAAGIAGAGAAAALTFSSRRVPRHARPRRRSSRDDAATAAYRVSTPVDAHPASRN